MLSYAQDAFWTGIVSGGEVTKNAGLILDVAAGTGFVNDGSNPIAVSWSSGSITLSANKASEYVYVSRAGVISHSETHPSHSDTIVLATGSTNGTDVTLLTLHDIELQHRLSTMAEFFERAVGPIMESGCLATLS